MLPAFIAYLHHLAAFTVVSCLVAEHLYLSDPLTHASARKLLILDLIYGVSAAILVAAGFSRALFLEKGPAFYFHNAFFLAKISLALAVGLASIYPTLEFLSWRGAIAEGVTPSVDPAKMRRVLSVVRAELAAVAAILACAALMAKGIGFFGTGSSTLP